MAREPLSELTRQSRERLAIGAVRPEHVAARPAAPCGDVAPANGRPRSGTLAVEKEEVVSARLDAEPRRPTITDGRELGAQPAADPCRTRREDPWSWALQLALWDGGCSGLRAEASGCQLRPGGVGPCCNQGHRVDCRVEHVGDRLRQGRRALDARVLSQPPAQRLCVAAGRELGGNEQRNDAARTGELERAFGERHGKIGQVGKATGGSHPWTPAGVARGQRFAHAWRQPLGAHPRRVPNHEIEPTLRHHIGKVGFEREERGRAVQSQPSARGPQLTQAPSETSQPQSLLEVEAAPPAEQVAIATGVEQVGDRRLERCAAVVQESPRERRLRAAQLRLRCTFHRTRKVKVRAARRGESSDLRGIAAEGAAAE